MSAGIFAEGMPHGLIRPMWDDGYAIKPGTVDADFATELFGELQANGHYRAEDAARGVGPDVHHEPRILSHLRHMPLLAEYLRTLNDAIIDVTGNDRQHLTYLTTRACPVGEMSTHIHRNDDIAGPWLVALTMAGSGSFNIYPDDTLRPGQEIPLRGDDRDPLPLASSDMGPGDVWGIYSREWSAPHAGGPNTSPDPKALLLLYGWAIRDEYPYRSEIQHQ